jgi:hypothetical protein
VDIGNAPVNLSQTLNTTLLPTKLWLMLHSTLDENRSDHSGDDGQFWKVTLRKQWTVTKSPEDRNEDSKEFKSCNT